MIAVPPQSGRMKGIKGQNTSSSSLGKNIRPMKQGSGFIFFLSCPERRLNGSLPKNGRRPIFFFEIFQAVLGNLYGKMDNDPNASPHQKSDNMVSGNSCLQRIKIFRFTSICDILSLTDNFKEKNEIRENWTLLAIGSSMAQISSGQRIEWRVLIGRNVSFLMSPGLL